MFDGENPDLPTTLRRCGSAEHQHDAAGAPVGAPRSTPEVRWLAAELDRRRCGGPLTPDGTDRWATDDWLGVAQAGLPETEHDRALAQVLADMEIRTVEDLSAFRRLVAVEAAALTLAWATGTPRRGRSVHAEHVLAEIDDPMPDTP